ncbi:SGNH/GDSL hydrolase family protein [Subtercola boreus]|uniref:SGNH/GDSL hydrolase family protein n=1 Tax=Subtercola boreus TaxID=120213 RepID=UPI00114F9667|nr:SGNH/GDSL hydrolase family protein [Subtercola boreus]TQL56135.1 lysophospholipase L1-like esterase [Subtercola boreus]
MSRRGRVVGVVACAGVLGILLVALPVAGHGSTSSYEPGALTQAILAPSPSPSPPAGPAGTAGTAEGTAGASAPASDGQDAGGTSAGTVPGAGAPSSVPTPNPAPMTTRDVTPFAPLAPEQLAPAGISPGLGEGTATQAGAPPEAPAPVVVAIGDSIMSGHGLDDPSQSWPERLASRNGWQLTDLADDGTGFVQPGDADDTFQTQADLAVQLDPSIVIIAASNNDLGVDSGDLEAQTMSTVQSLRAALPNAQIIALSAFWGDESPPDELQEATDDIHSAADAIGATFVDIGQPLAGRPDLMQDDDVHPTAAGQELLAQSIEADIAAAFAGG